MVGSLAGYATARSLPVTPSRASAFRTCILTGFPTTSTVLVDSYVEEGKGSTNYGTNTGLQITSKGNGNRRAFIRFNLATCSPALGASAAITSATLRLALATAPDSARTYNLHRVTGPCPEAASACWTETGLTWNNKPAVSGTPTAAVSLGTGSALVYYGWNVTSDVAGMVAGTTQNYGWQLADSAENATGSPSALFESSELSSNADEAPTLVIAYRR